MTTTDATVFPWLTVPGLLFLGINAALVAAATMRLIPLLRLRSERIEDIPQVAILLSLAQVVLASLVLGYAGIFAVGTSIATHAVFTLLVYRLPCPHDRPVRRWLQSVRSSWRGLEWPAKALGMVLLGMLLLLFLAAFVTAPFTYDSHSYRLTRVAYWLQEGSIRHFPTFDPRMNYMSVNVALVMQWLAAPFAEGFPFAPLAQFAGGILSLCATYGIARCLGFARPLRLLALVILLGMGNTAGQFITTQSDLITAGCLNSGLYFLLRSFQERDSHWSLPGWLGVALAVGAKGTVFYWGPGLVFFYLAMARLQRAPLPWILRSWRIAIPLLAIFALPRYVENQIHYGNPFAPAEEIGAIHADEDRSILTTASHNALLYVTQLGYPVTNPALPRFLLEETMEWLMGLYPDDWTAGERQWREGNIRISIEETRFEADIANMGAISLLLFMLGGGFAAWRSIRHPERNAVAVTILAVSVIGFLVFFCFQQAWTPFKHRYFVILSPFVAVAGAYPFHRAGIRVQRFALGLLLLPALVLHAQILCNNQTSGLSILWNDEDLRGARILDGHRSLVRRIVNEGDRVAVARPYNVLLSGFFRNGHPYEVAFFDRDHAGRFADPAAFLDDEGFDVLITDPQLFSDRHGAIHTEAFLSAIWKERESVLGYRRLAPGETANPFIDHRSYKDFPDNRARVHAFSIQNNQIGELPFTASNRGNEPVTLAIKSEEAEREILLLPGESLQVLHPAGVSEMMLFRVSAPSTDDWSDQVSQVSIEPAF